MSVRVVVTGAGGRLGRVVVGLLVAEGWDVLAVDRRFEQEPDLPHLRADLCDLGAVFGAFTGAAAVVHLGAVPSPIGWAPEYVFSNNATSQFNVFEAAAKLGVRRVVSASSISAYGFPFQHVRTDPSYLPIDEDHPLVPQDAYGLSKAVGEEIAAAYCRRGAGDAVSLRISRVVDDPIVPELVEEAVDYPERFAKEQWSYVHVRDVARACLLALTQPIDGHLPVHVTAAEPLSALPSDELAARWFPKVPIRDHEAGPHWSLIDPTRAREVLGYRPAYSIPGLREA